MTHRTLHTIIAMLLFCSGHLSAQENQNDFYSHEIEIGTDNDFLVFQTQSDKYYTYGVNASFRWIPKGNYFLNNLFSDKTGYFQSVGLNIEAYTPDYRSERMDLETARPYAGWSYVELDATYGFKQSFFRIGLDLGILGPDSQAGQIQNWFHEKVTGDPTLPGWKDQLPNQFGLNIRSTYALRFWGNSWFDTYGIADASLGNIYTYIEPRINFRFGKFNTLASSVSNHNAILSKKRNKELFTEIGFATKITAYNATIQGNSIADISFVSNDELNNALYRAHWGIYYAKNRFSFASRYVYSRGEINNNDSHSYVVFTAGYRFD